MPRCCTRVKAWGYERRVIEKMKVRIKQALREKVDEEEIA